ncbi:MAG: metallophosphoesterase [Candidatus Competibacteraceae bacterium]
MNRSLETRTRQRTYHLTSVLTDLEGRRDALDALVATGKLYLIDNQLEFVHPCDQLVFAGDLPDRGIFSIRLVALLSDLKRRYPDRVMLLWGNRDLNKLGLLCDLPELEKKPNSDYLNWLLQKLDYKAITGNPDRIPFNALERMQFLQYHNTLVNRIDYWLERHGARGALELHRQELEALQGVPITIDQAADDYFRRIQPGGSFFEYLRFGQILHVEANVLYVHGGVTEVSIGIVPGYTEKYADAREWIRMLNSWGKQQFALVEQGIQFQGEGKQIPRQLLDYGDAVWDPTAYASDKQGVTFMNHQSVIYGMRQREDGNFRAPSWDTITYLRRAGIDTEIVGHSPAGDVPEALRVPGFARIMADTSHGRVGSCSTLTVDAQGNIQVSGRTGSGILINYRLTVHSPSPIGQITEEGFIIVGRSRVDGRTRYVLSKYYDGYQIAEKLITRVELAALNCRPAIITQDEDTLQHRDVLIANLLGREEPVRIHLLNAVAEDFIGDRIPIVLSGASKFAQYPTTHEYLQDTITEFVNALDPGRVLFLTGGTDHGVERILHRLAREHGFKVLGFIHEGAIPGEIKCVRDVVLAGARNQWIDPLLAALNMAKQKGGFALFIGGGSVVKQGIDYAAASGITYFLMQRDPLLKEGATGGASAEAAVQLDAIEQRQRVFGSARELCHLIARQGISVFPSTQGTENTTTPLRIGVYIGSFDPVHNGHQAVVERMRAQYRLDLIYVVPDRVTDYKHMAAIRHREQMVAGQFQHRAWVKLLTPAMQATLGQGEM